jgi:hypothetical protein
LFVLYLALSLSNAAFLLHAFLDSTGKCAGSNFFRFDPGTTCPLLTVATGRSVLWVGVTAPLFATQFWQITLGVTTNERMNRGHVNYEYLESRKFGGTHGGSWCWKAYWQLSRYARNWRNFVAGGSSPDSGR